MLCGVKHVMRKEANIKGENLDFENNKSYLSVSQA